MVNKRWYFRNRPHVESILEIRLCPDTWEKVRQIARIKKVSYSWVVRYSLFRLIKRNRPSQYLYFSGGFPFEILSRELKWLKLKSKVEKRRTGSNLKHRHRLCLYGEDELYIRLVAAQLRCTMTHLVRLALERFLDSILNSLHRQVGSKGMVATDAFWYWLGIKLMQAVELPSLCMRELKFKFLRFKRTDYY